MVWSDLGLIEHPKLEFIAVSFPFYLHSLMAAKRVWDELLKYLITLLVFFVSAWINLKLLWMQVRLFSAEDTKLVV